MSVELLSAVAVVTQVLCRTALPHQCSSRPTTATASAGHYRTDVLQDWYSKIGFDPATMSEDEIPRLMEAAGERWRASIPGTPLGKRERKALAQLAAHGVGVAVHWSKIKDCGPDTEERLETRGYIETRNQTKYPDRIDTYILTEAGLAAWKQLAEEPDKGESDDR